MGLIFMKFNPDSLSFQVAPLAYPYKIWPSAPTGVYTNVIHIMQITQKELGLQYHTIK